MIGLRAFLRSNGNRAAVWHLSPACDPIGQYVIATLFLTEGVSVLTLLDDHDGFKAEYARLRAELPDGLEQARTYQQTEELI